ncbi:hypothetical protein FM112_12475 [Gulosibacter sp. 10]|nr:hypothetical protein FM112_12475 [Gulosibacter sp. 10]
MPGGSAPDGSAPGRTPSGHDGAYGRPRPSTPHGAPQHGAPQHGSPQHSQFGSATAAFGAPGRTPGHTPGPGSASAHPTSPATKQDARTGRGARATVVLLSLLLPIGIAAGLVAGYLYADRFQSYDTAAVEREVVSVLRDDYGLSDLQEVNCPDWVKVEQGTSFQCEFEYAGATQTVTVTQGSQSGQLVVGAPDGQ